MLSFKSSMGMTGRSTLQLAQKLRGATRNRKVVEPGLKHVLRKQIHKLDGVFSIEKKYDSPIVYCNDINELLDIVQQERGLCISDTTLKIGIDAGGGFLKVCLNVMCEEVVPVKRRLSFENGAAGGKCGGVKKLIILAISPGMQENYENVSRVLKSLKLDELPPSLTIKYAADLKMVNLLLGLMSHASRHPCSWCDITR